jgi:hypothetical protein
MLSRSRHIVRRIAALPGRIIRRLASDYRKADGKR